MTVPFDSETFTWQGKKIEAVPCYVKPWVVALPQEDGLPVLATENGNLFYRCDRPTVKKVTPIPRMRGGGPWDSSHSSGVPGDGNGSSALTCVPNRLPWAR